MKGQCVELRGGGTPLFFLAVREGHPRHLCLPEEGGAAGESPAFSTHRPLFAGGTPCRLFYCLWTTEPDRHALPKLSDPLRLPGEHQEEGEGVENTRVQTSGSGRPPEVFFCPAVWGADADVAVLSTKVAGPFLYGVSCEIYTHFTVGQRDRCKPTGTTDLHMSYT